MNAQGINWNDLHLVMAIGRNGSLSGAARTLGINHSTVFRRLVQIEDKLDVRLFDRLPTGYQMTEAGKVALKSAEVMEAEVNQLSRHLMGRDLELYGNLNVTLPDAFCLHLFIQYLPEFNRLYPEICLDFSIDNLSRDLSLRQADIAIRMTNNPPEHLVGKRMAKMQLALYASISYLKQEPEKSLENYHWLLPNNELDQLNTRVWLKKQCKNVKVIFTSNTLLTLHKAVTQNLGVAFLPCFMADPDDSLVRILPPIKELSLNMWILFHPDLRHTARVTAFKEFFVDVMEKHIKLIEAV